MFANFDVRLDFLASGMLDFDGTGSDLGRFVPYLCKLKNLRDFDMINFDFIDPPQMALFKDVPIKETSTKIFKLEKGKIGEVVKELNNLKKLNFLSIEESFWTHYKLSPEDFELFTVLPVDKFVNLDVLDLTVENVSEFQRIMKNMKITMMEYSEGDEIYDEIDVSEKEIFIDGVEYLTI